MKYTIEGFSQEKAVELGLTSEDLVLLRWFVDFYGTGKMVKHLLQDGVYVWIDYKTVLEQLPIIKCNKRNLTSRFNRLVDAGVLTHKTLKQGGTFAVYGFGAEYDGLIYEQATSKNEPTPRLNLDVPNVQNRTYPTSKNERTPRLKSDVQRLVYKDSSTKDYSTRIKEEKQEKENAAILANDGLLENIENQSNNNDTKKEPENKAVKHKHGEYNNVLLTDEELEKIKALFPGDWQERIERLSEYVASTGKRYKSHYATIRSWARRNGNNSNGGKANGQPAKHDEPDGWLGHKFKGEL